MDIDSLQEIAERAVDEERIKQFPPIVKGRVLHADADVLSYKACDTEHSYGANVETLTDLIDVWRRLAGAEFIFLHLTMGHKGGREEIAKVRKYQGNRVKRDPEKGQRVDDLRDWMSEYQSSTAAPIVNWDQEADDSMTQHMYQALKHGQDAVLFSVDKDLWMVPGKHLNPNTLEIEEYPEGYGGCYLQVNAEGRKKLKGKGTSWFWHQMLMGDQADNVPGLPFLTKQLWTRYAPTKKVQEMTRRINSGRMPSGKLMDADQKRRALDQYQAMYKELKDKPVGAVLTFKYLETCLNEKMAYERVREAYTSWYKKSYKFTSWDNKELIATADEMLLEQARLLWMRRTKGEDVKTYLDALRKT